MTDPLLDRLPPHSRETEQALIGGLLRDPDVFDDVRAELRDGGDFYFDAHQKVFGAIDELHRAGQPVDLHLVFERLKAADHLADVGGPKYLADLWEAVPTGLNAAHHARVIGGYAARRRLIHACNEVIRDAMDGTAPPEEIAAHAEQRVIDAAAGGGADEPAADDDLLGDCLAAIDDRKAGHQSVLGTGLCDLDHILGGLVPGEVVVVGARPSTGKTSLALTFANNATKQRVGVYFASLEMSRRQLGNRLLSLRSGVPFVAFTGNRFPDSEQAGLLVEARKPVPGNGRLWIDDKVARTSAAVFSAARKAVRKRKVGLVVVDYLQLMRDPGNRDGREQVVAEASARLKLLAVTCNVPVVLLAQLNRETEKEKRRPRLSDLRESGSIEQDADKVVFLHWADGQEDEKGNMPDDAKLELLVEKNRNGVTGATTVLFRQPVMRMENLARGHL